MRRKRERKVETTGPTTSHMRHLNVHALSSYTRVEYCHALSRMDVWSMDRVRIDRVSHLFQY